MARDGRYAGLESPPRPRWWFNGLGWCLFVVGPGCGLAVGLAIGKVVYG